MEKITSNILKLTWYFSLLYFSYLMLLISLQYVPINYEVAFLNLKQEEIKLGYYKVAFFSHVYTSIFVLLFGSTQFSKTIRNRFNWIHKNSGRLYVFLILCIAAPSGFVMALYANGGFYSKISFSLQAILWFGFTYRAFSSIKKQNWSAHKHFMLRSYALTLSAISLRLFKWIIVSTIQLPPMDTYKIVAWLGWIFNLLLVEIYIYSSSKKLKQY